MKVFVIIITIAMLYAGISVFTAAHQAGENRTEKMDQAIDSYLGH